MPPIPKYTNQHLKAVLAQLVGTEVESVTSFVVAVSLTDGTTRFLTNFLDPADLAEYLDKSQNVVKERIPESNEDGAPDDQTPNTEAE